MVDEEKIEGGKHVFRAKITAACTKIIGLEKPFEKRSKGIQLQLHEEIEKKEE